MSPLGIILTALAVWTMVAVGVCAWFWYAGWGTPDDHELPS